MPTRRELLISALLARGYSECKMPEFCGIRVFSISPTHKRRLDHAGARVWVPSTGAHPRFGERGPRLGLALRQTLAEEGAKLLLIRGKPQAISLHELGLTS